jgi:molecular chaperone DnaJ
MTDFYALLEANENASEAEIRAAYRRLAKKYHPDTNPGDKAAEARFKEIGEAYAVLGSEEKRKDYDSKRRGEPRGRAPSGRAAPRKAASVGPFDANAAFEKFFGKR